jgi:hypothetical protein
VYARILRAVVDFAQIAYHDPSSSVKIIAENYTDFTKIQAKLRKLKALLNLCLAFYCARAVAKR